MLQNLNTPLTQEAKLTYEDGDYQIVRHGHYVCCSVTGQKIPLSELRYWSAELQEAYAGPEAVLVRAKERGWVPEKR
jgi:hypothetical protein